jgi:anti-sigma28 factor (negative regulator of flagellin synthesis)
MRVDNKSVDTLGTETRSGAAQKIAQQGSQLSTSSTGVSRGDQASLSSATNLVALAKNATSATRQARISALTEQVRSGSYQGNTAQAGQGMVHELLQSRTSAAHS